MAEKILITGPFGQIGSDLIPELQKKYGKDSVIALGHKNIPADYKGIVEKGDVRDKAFMDGLIKKHKITTVYHLASLLSAVGEKDPQLAWDVNMNGLKAVLDLAVEHKFSGPPPRGTIPPSAPSLSRRPCTA
jgi:nucleoside-diphosphate-sugar epimerase